MCKLEVRGSHEMMTIQWSPLATLPTIGTSKAKSQAITSPYVLGSCGHLWNLNSRYGPYIYIHIYIRSMQGYAPAAPHSYGFKWYSASSRGSGKWPLIGSTFCYSIEGTVFIFLFLKVNIFSGYPPVTKHGNWKSPNSMEADRWENQL